MIKPAKRPSPNRKKPQTRTIMVLEAAERRFRQDFTENEQAHLTSLIREHVVHFGEDQSDPKALKSVDIHRLLTRRYYTGPYAGGEFCAIFVLSDEDIGLISVGKSKLTVVFGLIPMRNEVVILRFIPGSVTITDALADAMVDLFRDYLKASSTGRV